MDAIFYAAMERAMVTLDLLALETNFHRHHPNTRRLIVGDFNAHDKSWDPSYAGTDRTRGYKLAQAMENAGMQQILRKGTTTRRGTVARNERNSTIDLV
jgi:hypothetical protein